MKWLGGLLAAVAALGVYLYFFAFPVYEHRFRLTFEVEVDGEVKTGSSVITVADQHVYTSNGPNWNRTSRGPSPWVDLGPRGTLLIAMYPSRIFQPAPNAASALSFVAYYDAKSGDLRIGNRVNDINSKTGKVSLRLDQMPEFIWLPNRLDPRSAQFLDASSISKVIGPSVQLGDVYVEMTTERADNSLYSHLPWLTALQKKERAKMSVIKPGDFHTSFAIGER